MEPLFFIYLNDDIHNLIFSYIIDIKDIKASLLVSKLFSITIKNIIKEIVGCKKCDLFYLTNFPNLETIDADRLTSVRSTRLPPKLRYCKLCMYSKEVIKCFNFYRKDYRMNFICYNYNIIIRGNSYMALDGCSDNVDIELKGLTRLMLRKGYRNTSRLILDDIVKTFDRLQKNNLLPHRPDLIKDIEDINKRINKFTFFLIDELAICVRFQNAILLNNGFSSADVKPGWPEPEHLDSMEITGEICNSLLPLGFRL